MSTVSDIYTRRVPRTREHSENRVGVQRREVRKNKRVFAVAVEG
jgi:hypothetical protein